MPGEEKLLAEVAIYVRARPDLGSVDEATRRIVERVQRAASRVPHLKIAAADVFPELTRVERRIQDWRRLVPDLSRPIASGLRSAGQELADISRRWIEMSSVRIERPLFPVREAVSAADVLAASQAEYYQTLERARRRISTLPAAELGPEAELRAYDRVLRQLEQRGAETVLRWRVHVQPVAPEMMAQVNQLLGDVSRAVQSASAEQPVQVPVDIRARVEQLEPAIRESVERARRIADEQVARGVEAPAMKALPYLPSLPPVEVSAEAAEGINQATRALSDVGAASRKAAAELYEAQLAEQEMARQARARLHEVQARVEEAMGALTESVRRKVPGSVVQAAAEAVLSGRVTVDQAVAAIDYGVRNSGRILKSLGTSVTETGLKLTNLSDALKLLRSVAMGGAAEVPRIPGLSKASDAVRAIAIAAAAAAPEAKKLAAETKQAGEAAKKSGPSLREISFVLRQSLSAEGLKAPAAVITLASKAIQSGMLTYEQAITAISTGMKFSSQVMNEMGVTSHTAGKALQQMTRSILDTSSAAQQAAAAAGGAGGAVPPIPAGGALVGGLPPAGRVVALASAFHRASAGGTSLMKALLQLRWELFTVLFFFSLVARNFGQMIDTFRQGAVIVDSVRTGFAVLRAAGIRDVGAFVARIQQASGYTMSFAEATGVAARSALRGVDREIIELFPTLMRYAQLLSIASGGAETSEQVFTKMVEAIQRGQVRLAVTTGATTGTMTNLLDMFKSVADEAINTQGPVGELARLLYSSGVMAVRGAEGLTPYQKQLLVAWQIMRLAEQALGGVGDQFDETSSKVNQAARAWEESWKALKASVADFFAPLGEYISYLIYASYLVADAFTQLILITKFTTGEDRWRRMAEFAAGYAVAISKAREEIGKPPETWGLEDYLKFLSLIGRNRAISQQAQDTRQLTGVNNEMIQQLQSLLGGEGALEEQGKRTNDVLRERYQILLRAMESWLDYLLDVEREEEDVARRRRRDEEDLEIEIRRRREDMMRNAAKQREAAQRDYDKRREEAARDLARRLAQIERDLAIKLRDIWRDYNEKLYDAIAERDAIQALMAQRERDRRIQEANEWAEDQRQTAYEQYQDRIEDEQRQFQERMRQIEEQLRDEEEEFRIWLQRRREDMLLAYQREDEDRAIARQRREQDMMRQLQWELLQLQINNSAKLSEYERYFNLALALRRLYEAQLGRPIVIPIQFSYPTPPPGLGGRFATTPRVQSTIVSRQQGGVDFFTRPAAVLVHPGEMVATVPMNRPSAMNVSVNGVVRHSVSAMVQAQIAGMEGRIAAAVTAALVNTFRSLRR